MRNIIIRTNNLRCHLLFAVVCTILLKNGDSFLLLQQQRTSTLLTHNTLIKDNSSNSIGNNGRKTIHNSIVNHSTMTNRLHSSYLKSTFNDIIELSPDNTSLKELPIMDVLDTIQSSIDSKSNLLLQAAPGAGKTTIVPLSLALSSATTKNIIVVEPRRVATRSAAQRMSSILNEPIGQTVGYTIRGESKLSSKTSITVMTDGVLLNKLRDDPELNGVDVIILDEFHERGVGSDTVLALCREVQMNFRPDDLKIVVMSATLLGDAEEAQEEKDHNVNEIRKGESKNHGGGVISSLNKSQNETVGSKLLRVLGGYSNCDIVKSEGRQYPITYQHAKRGSPPLGLLLNDLNKLIETMSDTIEEGLRHAPSNGDVLAFLPGAKEIRKVVQELKSRQLSVDILPLYGALPKKEQDIAIRPSNLEGRRRVIVASPIAEASLTIQGVTCVVDSGLRREPRFDVDTGLPRLITVPCSKNSAIQRSGRAGRTRHGLCLRLYNEAEYNQLETDAPPEICSTDLVPTTLFLSDWGCSSAREIINDMPFVDPPPEDGMKKAFQMLDDLEALERNDNSESIPVEIKSKFRVTPHGRKLAKLPTHPRFASAIIKAGQVSSECLAAAVVSVALIEEEMPGWRRESNIANDVKNVLLESESSMFSKQISQFASRIGPEAQDAVSRAFTNTAFATKVVNVVGNALLPGFVDLIAQYKGEASYSSSTYMLSLGRSARLDGIQDAGDYIVVLETSSGDDGIARIRSYVPIGYDELRRIAVEKDDFYTVASRGHEVRARRVLRVGSLELSSSPIQQPSSEIITNVLLQTISSLGGVNKALIQIQPKKTKEAVEELRSRIRFATKLSTDNIWPECFAALDAIDDKTSSNTDEELLLEMIQPWLSAAGSLKDVNIHDILFSALTPEQMMYIDQYFPTSIEAPDGSSIPLSYGGEVPTASAKLQQFFGSTESPYVGDVFNREPVSLNLLSPSGKPLAQTRDLKFFWTETYPTVRSEMRGRYPKHPWPEDPMNAVPTRLSKKQLAKSEEDKVDHRKERNAQKKRKGKKK